MRGHVDFLLWIPRFSKNNDYGTPILRDIFKRANYYENNRWKRACCFSVRSPLVFECYLFDSFIVVFSFKDQIIIIYCSQICISSSFMCPVLCTIALDITIKDNCSVELQFVVLFVRYDLHFYGLNSYIQLIDITRNLITWHFLLCSCCCGQWRDSLAIPTGILQ